MMNAKVPYAGIGEDLEEAGSRLLFRVYEWGRNTAKDAEKLESELTAAVLAAFEQSLKSLVRWGGGSISELTGTVRSRVEAGIADAEERIMREVDAGYAVLKDADKCDRDLKRCELAAKYVRQKTEARIRAVSEKGADAAISFVLRQSEIGQDEKNAALERIKTAESEREELEIRLSKLNSTLKEAVTKFVGNRKSLLTEIEAEKTAKTAAIRERDGALTERDASVAERDEAKRETRLARELYEKVARKASDVDKIAGLLKGFWKSGASPVTELGDILNELRRANSEIGTLRSENGTLKSENGKLNGERVAYQRTTARNFELERQVSMMSETLAGLENQVRAEIALRVEAEEAAEALKFDVPRTENELRATSGAYYSVMLRMEGSDPEARDYSDYERLERELERWIGLSQSKGIDGFSVSAKSVALARDEWLANPANLKSIGVSRVSAQAAYEKCVREIGRMTVPKSVRDVAEKLKIYADVAGIAGSRVRPETIVDAEFS